VSCSRPWILPLTLLFAAACGEDAPAAPSYPLDDTLRLNHVQVAGTHNSYHIDNKQGVPGLDYTHAPIPTQLSSQGVRQLEIDVHWDITRQSLRVYHIPVVDTLSTCDLLTDCLGQVKRWSDANPGHLPVLILLEPKDKAPAYTTGARPYDRIEADLLKVFPRSRLLTPDDVRGAAATLNAAVTADGWPTLGKTRGKVIAALLGDGDTYAAGKDLSGKPMFATGGEGKPYGALVSYGDPGRDEAKVRAAAKAGYLIRARADSPGDGDAKKNNTKKREGALAGGAHFISTDYPAKVPGIDYVMKIPGGTPARCNPVTAPKTCTPAALENL